MPPHYTANSLTSKIPTLAYKPGSQSAVGPSQIVHPLPLPLPYIPSPLTNILPAGPTRSAFSSMSTTSTNRQTFINGLIKFMDTYGFDGIDLDWEYPASDDRGGNPADFSNYVILVKEIRQAFGKKYGFSITLPASYWYLQHFDLRNIQDSVDWFNFMAYDLHGEF